MGVELAYVAVATILLLSALGLSVWAGASVIYKIRDNRLEETSPEPVEHDVVKVTDLVDYYPTGERSPVREYAVSKPLPMPKKSKKRQTKRSVSVKKPVLKRTRK